MKSTQSLSEEHRVIERYLAVLEKIIEKPKFGGEDISDLEKILDFIRNFADRCHHGKEEDVLFPAMGKAGVPRDGGPIGMMLYEHKEGRGYVAGLTKALGEFRNGKKDTQKEIRDNAQSYIEFLQSHIPKEDNILYPMAEEVLTDADDQRLLKQFEEIEEKRIGPGAHEKYHALIDELEKRWG